MGGKSTQDTTTSQNGTSNESSLLSGVTSSTATKNPWEAAMPAMSGILSQLQGQVGSAQLTGNETNALNQLSSNASQGNPYAGQIGSYANSLLNGGGAKDQAGNVQGALDTYKGQLTPYANGSMVGNNSALRSQLDTIMSDVGNSVNGQFAAAGRDMSGANQQAYGRGVSQGMAPVIANQYNQDVANQLSAAGSLYGAGNTTAGLLSGMNQNYLANQGQGVTASQSALDANNYGANQQLAIEQLKRSIPTQQLGLLAQIGVPIAGLGGTATQSGSNNQNMSGTTNTTQNGTSNTENQMSGVQQFMGITSGLASLFGKK